MKLACMRIADRFQPDQGRESTTELSWPQPSAPGGCRALGGKWCRRGKLVGVRSTSLKNVGDGVCSFPRSICHEVHRRLKHDHSWPHAQVGWMKVSPCCPCAKPPSPPFWSRRTYRQDAYEHPHVLVSRQSTDTSMCPCFDCYSPLGICAQVKSFAGKFILVVAKEDWKQRSRRGAARSSARDVWFRAPRVRAVPRMLQKGGQS